MLCPVFEIVTQLYSFLDVYIRPTFECGSVINLVIQRLIISFCTNLCFMNKNAKNFLQCVAVRLFLFY